MFHFPHPDLAELLLQVENYAKAFEPPSSISNSPIMCPTLIFNGQQVRTLSTVMRFDKAVNVTMAEIRVELVFPADDESDVIFRNL